MNKINMKDIYSGLGAAGVALRELAKEVRKYNPFYENNKKDVTSQTKICVRLVFLGYRLTEMGEGLIKKEMEVKKQ